MKYRAEEVDLGYHPQGYRIDKGTGPLNRYTQWTITINGEWVDAKPVCFHSMPAEGWYKEEKLKKSDSSND